MTKDRTAPLSVGSVLPLTCSPVVRRKESSPKASLPFSFSRSSSDLKVVAAQNTVSVAHRHPLSAKFSIEFSGRTGGLSTRRHELLGGSDSQLPIRECPTRRTVLPDNETG